jgi:hypothetical protein
MPGQADTYWEKLQYFPEEILTDMLDDFLREGCERCPTVGEMMQACQRIRRIKEEDYIRAHPASREKDYTPLDAKARERRDMMFEFLKGNMRGDDCYAELEKICTRHGIPNYPETHYEWMIGKHLKPGNILAQALPKTEGI